jgi:P-type Ca2+ transporter type 2C
MNSQPKPVNAWHSVSPTSVLEKLDTTERGLMPAEAQRRLAEVGPNRLPQQPPPRWWQILGRQFQSPLIYILVVAAIVAAVAGDYKDAVFIALVLVINAAIGGYQEWKAEQSSRALQKLLHIRAAVQRGGAVHEVDAEEVVPGDIVWLESGNRVPADLRLLSTQGLEIDESLLTGESLAVSKAAQWIGDVSVPVADRLNLAYAASIVVRGRAKGVVVGTGTRTEVGKVAADVMSSTGGRPPLLDRMEKFSHAIAYIVLLAVVVVSLMGILLHGYTIHEMFLFGVALAVSAIPEGLPAALTVALAVATTRMAKRGVIVRRLAAVEGLGSCTMIASDKTGTLTCNELTVREVRLADGTVLKVTGGGFSPQGEIRQGSDPVVAAHHDQLAAAVRVVVLCNEGTLHQSDGQWAWHGDPTDIALLAMGLKAGVARESLLEACPQVSEIPFEPEYQFAATFNHTPDGMRTFVKGAPERILEMCHWGGPAAERERWQRVAETMAAEGYRVLGLAEGTVAETSVVGQAPPQPSGLSFRGYVGMMDPLRAGVKEAVKHCHAAGIRVCMITGDHPVTALAISRELGLASDPDQVVSGADLAGKSPEEIRAAIRRGRVFARVAPRQKLELVEAARAEGHYVAVTGDGVNDAPALRAANIGVAMGKSGTDVAREAAELVISDDNFATIVSGVEEGRVAYDNVRKVIYLLVSTGAAEVLLIAATFAAGTLLPLPFLPVQLLWLNLVTNGIQGIALAFEPAEAGVLRRKPRPPSEPIFDRLMIERTVVGAVTMASIGVGAFAWMIAHGWSEDQARNGLLLLMVLFENVHIGNCRSEYQSALRISPLRSPYLLAGAIVAFLIHVAAMHLPFMQSLLRAEPVSLQTWITMAALALSVFIALEVHKWTWRWRYGNQ